MAQPSRGILGLLLILLTLASSPAQAQWWRWFRPKPSPVLIAESRRVDWTTAGIVGGIPPRTTICAALNPGATGEEISGALATCPSGQTVQLGAGTYTLTTGIDFLGGKTDVTLRGAGADQTLISFTQTAAVSCNGLWANVCMHSNDTNWRGGPVNLADWTASYAKGTTVLTLSHVMNLSIGDTLILDQLNDGGDNGAIYVCDSTTCTDDAAPGGAARTNRAQQQLVATTAITGTRVTISPGLYMLNWDASKAPAAWWANQPAANVGIEAVSLDHTAAGEINGLAVFNCSGCWVKGIRSINANRSHVHIELSHRTVVRDSYFYGGKGTGSVSYGIETFPGGDTLIENNIFQRVTAPQMLSGACSGCVVGYNFSIYDIYQSPSWLSHSLFLHAAGIDHVLVEGNVGVGMYSDLIHGTHHFVTVFRNRYNGWEATGPTSNLNPLNIYPFSRFYNLIGNVLGETGRQTTYQRTPSAGQSPAIYVLGTGTVNCCLGGDAAVETTAMRWGNYDVVTAGVRFDPAEVPSSLTGGQAPYANPVPVDHSLPASLYLHAKPGWWAGAKPWPAIGPDVLGGTLPNVGGHAYTIPAQDCYSSVMLGPADGTGGVLTFNAAACYGP